MKDEYLSVPEVMEFLGVSDRRVRGLIKHKLIRPVATLGGSLAFRKAEIAEYKRWSTDPFLMNAGELAKYYGISYDKALILFNKRYRAAAVRKDLSRGVLFDVRRPIQRHIEAMHKLTPQWTIEEREREHEHYSDGDG